MLGERGFEPPTRAPVMRRLCALQGGSPWSRTRFRALCNPVETWYFQVIDIEPVASRSLKAVESYCFWRLLQSHFYLHLVEVTPLVTQFALRTLET